LGSGPSSTVAAVTARRGDRARGRGRRAVGTGRRT
jgi:hypothetical protein